jgi:hypothetical protein
MFKARGRASISLGNSYLLKTRTPSMGQLLAYVIVVFLIKSWRDA